MTRGNTKKGPQIAHFVFESVFVVFVLIGCLSLFDVFSAQECGLQKSPVHHGFELILGNLVYFSKQSFPFMRWGPTFLMKQPHAFESTVCYCLCDLDKKFGKCSIS